ncbi:MAG: hypothetical protein RXQ96_06635 [Thermocladium sp.]
MNLSQLFEEISQLRLDVDGEALSGLSNEAPRLAEEACRDIGIDCVNLMTELLRRAGRGPIDSNYWKYMAYVDLMLAPRPINSQILLVIWSRILTAASRLGCRAVSELGKLATASMLLAMNIYMAVFSESTGANWDLMDTIVDSATNELIT